MKTNKTKLPPEVWEWCLGIHVMDADGWIDWPYHWAITKEEFLQRCASSTCSYPPKFFDKYIK